METQPRRYRNFTLRISPVKRRPNRYHVQIFGLIPGGQPAADEREAMTYDRAAFLMGPLNLLDAVQFVQMTQRQLTTLGATLADMLIAGSIRKRWWDSLGVTRERGFGLRLRLLFENAPDLVALPWEFLYLRPPWDNTDSELYFLALQQDISIVRHEMLDIVEPSLAAKTSYRLVAAQAAPSDQPKLALAAERKAIEDVIGRLPQAGLLQPTWVEQATRRTLRDALRTPADILHFSGHGRAAAASGQILLERADGGSDPYGATFLANLIQASPLRLAILNACQTGDRSGANPWNGVASALVRVGVAAVVASQYPILDVSATPLAEEIYLGVLKGLTVDEAVSNARRAIYQEIGIQTPDWAAPVLYLRAEEGLIFPPVLAGAIGAQVALPVPQVVPAAPGRNVPRVSPPRQDTPLLGRDAELSLAERGLEPSGKIYFYGSYGVGKTSVAAELYRRLQEQRAFADGCVWDRVSRLSAEKVLDRVASRFAGREVAEATSRDEKIQALGDLLAGRTDLLIALDEVDDRSVAQAILQAAGDCTLILNGTRRLNLAGRAAERRLEPLQPAVAEELFKTLARPSGAAFDDEETKLVADICRRMRYLPLAVKLAALKYAEGVETLESLRDRLAAEPQSLASPEDGVIAVFAAHHADLKNMPTALNLLVRIASFPALEASIKALQEGQPEFYSSKDKLVDLGLIDYAGPDRLVLHPLLGRQVERAEPEAIVPERERAEAWLVDYAARHREDYNALEQEQANLLALLDRMVEARRWDGLVGLLRNLFDYLRVRGQWEEAFQRPDAILLAGKEVTSSWNRGWLYLHRGIMHMLRADYIRAEDDLDAADRLFSKCNDQSWRGEVLYRRAGLSVVHGDLEQARLQLEQAIDWMGDTSSVQDRASAHEWLAEILVTQGELIRAKSHFDQALALGDTERQAYAHIALGRLARQAGQHEKAQGHFDAAASLIASIRDVLQSALLEQQLGYVHYYQGDYDQSADAFKQAQAIFQELKYKPGLAQVLHALGNVALAQEDLELAGQLYRNALDINETLGHKLTAAYNRYQLAVVDSRAGRSLEAEEAFSQVLAVAQDKKVKDIPLQAAVWFQLSNLALMDGDLNHAKKYVKKAQGLAQQVLDRFTEAAVLFQLGLLEAAAGDINRAKTALGAAHEAFVALRSPEATRVQQVVDQASSSTISQTPLEWKLGQTINIPRDSSFVRAAYSKDDKRRG